MTTKSCLNCDHLSFWSLNQETKQWSCPMNATAIWNANTGESNQDKKSAKALAEQYAVECSHYLPMN